MEVDVKYVLAGFAAMASVIGVLWRVVARQIDDLKSSNARKDSLIREQVDTLRAYAEENGALKKRLNGSNDHD